MNKRRRWKAKAKRKAEQYRWRAGEWARSAEGRAWLDENFGTK